MLKPAPLSTASAAAERTPYLQDKPIVLYCKSGVRSAEALATLKNAGFSTAKHVQGGVTAWATQVDKGLPVY